MFGNLGSPTKAKQTRFRHPSYIWQVTIYRIELKWDQTIFLHDGWLTVNDHVSKYASYVQVFLLSFSFILGYQVLRRYVSKDSLVQILSYRIVFYIYCIDISVLSCLCMYKSVIAWQSSRPNNQVFYHDIAGTISLSLSDDEDLDPRLFTFFENSVFKFRFNYRATYFDI